MVNGKWQNDHVIMFTLYLSLAVSSFPVKVSSFGFHQRSELFWTVLIYILIFQENTVPNFSIKKLGKNGYWK